jgi:hypothetical protein
MALSQKVAKLDALRATSLPQELVWQKLPCGAAIASPGLSIIPGTHAHFSAFETLTCHCHVLLCYVSSALL